MMNAHLNTTKHIPTRQCIACRVKTAPVYLVRLHAGKTERSNYFVITPTAVSLGRGAWIHPSEKCLQLAIKRGLWGKFFRTPGEYYFPSHIVADLITADTDKDDKVEK